MDEEKEPLLVKQEQTVAKKERKELLSSMSCVEQLKSVEFGATLLYIVVHMMFINFYIGTAPIQLEYLIDFDDSDTRT